MGKPGMGVGFLVGKEASGCVKGQVGRRRSAGLVGLSFSRLSVQEPPRDFEKILCAVVRAGYFEKNENILFFLMAGGRCVRAEVTVEARAGNGCFGA